VCAHVRFRAAQDRAAVPQLDLVQLHLLDYLMIFHIRYVSSLLRGRGGLGRRLGWCCASLRKGSG